MFAYIRGMNWKFWEWKRKRKFHEAMNVEFIKLFRNSEEVKKSLNQLPLHDKIKYELEIKLAELQIKEIKKSKNIRVQSLFWGGIITCLGVVLGALLQWLQSKNPPKETEHRLTLDTVFVVKTNEKDTSLVRLVKLPRKYP